MTHDRPFTGILLMLCFCVFAPMADSIAKLLGGVVALGTLLFVRFALQTVFLLPIALGTGLPLKLPEGTMVLTWLRTLLHIAGIGLMFSALRYLPLADTIAIAFVMPFIMLGLGYVFLGETVGMHRIAACCVGFIGTLLVIQPNFVNVGLPALLPLGVAVVFALFMLVTRKLAKKIDPIALQVISGTQASLILFPVLALWPATRAIAVINTETVLLLVALGFLGTISHLFMTWSLRLAPSTTLAPMQYIEIPVATVFGLILFEELPNGMATVGIAITVCAGLYIIAREQRLSRHQASSLAN